MDNDTIYRQAAIEAMGRVSDSICAQQAIDALADLPSAERRGRWVGYNTDKEGWKRTDGSPVFMSCSECNGTVLNNGSAHWNYCPNCGASMKGEV